MEASFYPYLGALCWIGMLLMLGTLIRAKVPLFQKLLFPSSLIGGLIGFVLINLDLVGMPTSTGWKDITPNIFSMITFHLFAFGFVGIGLLQTKKPASGKVVMRGALWIALVFGMTFSVQALIGKGVHFCAACDGAPYRGRTVAVVGGGNSAAADALTLSRIAQKVYLIHRRDSLRATKVYHEPLMNAPNVEFCWNSTVSALLHESRLTGLRLKDVNTGAEHDLSCDSVFISVGRAPATELFRSELALDKSGYIIADESTRTSLPGVFAVGDVRTKALRQVVTAVSDGAVAVHYAEEYLAENR